MSLPCANPRRLRSPAKPPRIVDPPPIASQAFENSDSVGVRDAEASEPFTHTPSYILSGQTPGESPPPDHRPLDNDLSAGAKEDAESNVGAKVFALLDALLLAGALITLTTLLIGRGLLAPPMQFGLAWLATGVLIGSGLLLERKQPLIGQILVGLGSLAASLTVAGGRFTFGLYGDETALTLLTAVAGINLAYGLRRREASSSMTSAASIRRSGSELLRSLGLSRSRLPDGMRSG